MDESDNDALSRTSDRKDPAGLSRADLEVAAELAVLTASAPWPIAVARAILLLVAWAGLTSAAFRVDSTAGWVTFAVVAGAYAAALSGAQNALAPHRPDVETARRLVEDLAVTRDGEWRLTAAGSRKLQRYYERARSERSRRGVRGLLSRRSGGR